MHDQVQVCNRKDVFLIRLILCYYHRLAQSVLDLYYYSTVLHMLGCAQFVVGPISAHDQNL